MREGKGNLVPRRQFELKMAQMAKNPRTNRPLRARRGRESEEVTVRRRALRLINAPGLLEKALSFGWLLAGCESLRC